MYRKVSKFAYEHFMDSKVDKSLCDKIYNEVIKEKDNIVLIGMPASGKTTIGKLLAEKTGKQFIDTDDEIVKAYGNDIPTIFKEKGEAYFRDLEAKIIEDVSKLNGALISTGGGAILREENVRALKQNAKVYFLDRSLELLMPTSDRPLSSDRQALEKRYNERYDKYLASADVRVNGDQAPSEVAEEIYKDWNK